MSILLSALLAALPNVFLSLLTPLVTKTFLTKVLRHVIVFALGKAAKLTTNTVDDQIVADIKAAFDNPTPQPPPPPPPPFDTGDDS